MIQDDYDALLKELQGTKNYMQEASQIALEAFQDFDAPTTTRYLQFFKEVWGEQNTAYKFTIKNLATLQNKNLPPRMVQARYFLHTILRFLPTKARMHVLLCEVLDIVQKQKKVITRNFTRKPNMERVFDMYSQYLAGLHNLDKHPFTWFHENSYNTSEKQDVLKVVEYLCVRKLQTSVFHFKKDLHIIAEKAARLPKRMTYLIELLGVEVEIDNTNYGVDKFKQYDELQIPDLKSDFAEELRVYMYEQLAEQDYAITENEMQEAVLAHDLETALLHYKQSQTLTNQVDISFLLKGGAGIVKLQIVSWLNKVLTSNSSVWEEDDNRIRPNRQKEATYFYGCLTTFLALPASLIFFMATFIPLTLSVPNPVAGVFGTLYFFLCVIGIPIAANRVVVGQLKATRFLKRASAIQVKLINTAEQNTFDAKVFMQKQKHKYPNEWEECKQIVQYKRAEREERANQGNVYDQMYAHLWQHLNEQKLQNEHPIKYPYYLLETFRQYKLYINGLSTAQIADFITTEDKITCLQVMRHILLLQLYKSAYYYISLVEILRENNMNGIFYIYFVNEQSVISPEFYEFDAKIVPASNPLRQFKTEVEVFYKEALAKVPHLPHASLELEKWFNVELSMIKHEHLQEEIKQVRAYRELIEQSKRVKHLVLLPLIMEGEECMLWG